MTMLSDRKAAQDRANLILVIANGEVGDWCERMLGASASPSGSRASRRTNLRCSAPTGFDPSRKVGE
jgi:hypothetical protein